MWEEGGGERNILPTFWTSYFWCRSGGCPSLSISHLFLVQCTFGIAKCFSMLHSFLPICPISCHVWDTTSGDLFPAFCTESSSPLYSWFPPITLWFCPLWPVPNPDLKVWLQQKIQKEREREKINKSNPLSSCGLSINYQDMSGLKFINRSKMVVCLVEWWKDVDKLALLISQLERLCPWLDLNTGLPKIPLDFHNRWVFYKGLE